jgi:RNA polymerase sigma-70 factor (ECF subfamily)
MKKMNISRVSDPSTWVDQYGDYLFCYALIRVRNRDLAENVVQETFLAALKGRASFSGRSSEKTWMTGILKHKLIDQFRKSCREKSITELQSDPEQSMDQFYDMAAGSSWHARDWMPDQLARLYSKEFWEVLRACLKKLPEPIMAAFVMRMLDGHGSKVVCQELGITHQNLWVRMHRARYQLRVLLENNLYEKGDKR